MFKLQNLTKYISKEVFFRFPLVFIFMFTTFILIIVDKHDILYFDAERKFLASSIIFTVLTTSFYLFFERIKKNILYKLALFIIFILLTYLGVFVYFDSIFFYSFAVLLTLVFANFLFIKSTNESILHFCLDTQHAIVVTFLGCLILALGIKAIFFSLDFLFNIAFFNDNISDIYIFIATIIFPTLVLSNIPKNIDVLIKKIEFNISWVILIKNILLPLLYVYIVVLYIYFIKISILQELPKGGLSWIIGIFLTLCIFVKLFLTSIKEKNFLSELFDKYFIYSMVIPLVFFNIAIYTRVSEYGITEQRYALIFLSIWFSYIVIYYFIKKEFCIKRSVIFLFILLLISSVSMFNASTISVNSQFNRLETILKENNILNNEKVIPLKKQLENEGKTKTHSDQILIKLEGLKKEQKREVRSIVRYLSKYKDGKKRLNLLFNTNLKSSSDFRRYLNKQYTNIYNVNFNLNSIAYNSSGYNYVVPIEVYASSQKRHYSLRNIYYFKYNEISVGIENDNLLEITFLNNNKTILFDLKQIFENWKKENIKDIDIRNYEKAIFYKKIDDFEVKLYIQSLRMSNSSNTKVNRIKGLIMIK